MALDELLSKQWRLCGGEFPPGAYRAGQAKVTVYEGMGPETEFLKRLEHGAKMLVQDVHEDDSARIFGRLVSTKAKELGWAHLATRSHAISWVVPYFEIPVCLHIQAMEMSDEQELVFVGINGSELHRITVDSTGALPPSLWTDLVATDHMCIDSLRIVLPDNRVVEQPSKHSTLQSLLADGVRETVSTKTKKADVPKTKSRAEMLSEIMRGVFVRNPDGGEPRPFEDMFADWDFDGDTFIGYNEMRRVLRYFSIEPDNALDIIRTLDTDDDSKLSCEEFLDFVLYLEGGRHAFREVV